MQAASDQRARAPSPHGAVPSSAPGRRYGSTRSGTGEAALREASTHALDVIVLDHHLPDMDGIQCLERLRQECRAYSPAVLLFTADWDVADEAAHIAELGAMFASKLCDLEEVGRLVGTLLMVRASLGETLRAS